MSSANHLLLKACIKEIDLEQVVLHADAEMLEIYTLDYAIELDATPSTLHWLLEGTARRMPRP